ncbi:MAG: hypothetical protein A3G52_01250 [Candidatus Taylorbacteria bacterium RIFCSPLOWO2_12_FULL_43_20]|uniref:Protease PrsW n=1 Tax=Candidatus Taylorbacteria bacterium RIFCSPLOWO2_12_FULL_43_20 TaxID=1802332 RepID=A0A1G2P3F0_9BACT|nr:MAG: hypothetical protein A2825_00645 [Candidatus Taylorbacteria bacterium RIFCSPHIGHO2_01_FULL_43_120]OHA22320.1 MAG: hypothetical protein A3B98_04370 [Candidatus Taylorbacteria bacterium RIFCSPHIGHO2_02_FULL_43_55]OHA30047.1 MAG: hypothetical protein A3E92_03330 [Candidatus Taylorbacteria bacterium RIFCSPHIGHO2_12_FULL_42_34]OHA30446.1 MAG: hypothetical protein A3B09_04395 [Candidatus Taylorbacteria bacterium RIFCSPLOWO2_01_FULL_43_83]OHA39528.1 MAG: hypothetical protein A3H58_02630 [Candi
MVNASTVVFGIIGGVIPALIWLWFWLKEDPHPEPRRLLVLSFLAGMLAVAFVIPFQKLADDAITSMFWLIVAWAAIEEILKFAAAYWAGIRRKEDDEPVDPIIYLLTAALGFAALENTLFIFNPLFDGNFTLGILTGNLRFIGATLLHIIASASIGVALGLAFYKSKTAKFLYFLIGLAVSVTLHSAFNLFIINNENNLTFTVFYFVWITIIVLLLYFEKIKNITKCSSQNNYEK